MIKLPVNKYIKILAIICTLGLLYIGYTIIPLILAPTSDPVPPPQLPRQY